ncbi:MAG: 30S ribosomal protein S8 [Chloroflexi bacterium]|nr:30S ribosomal protein S8 [Chloroflexota bacterium]
MSGITDPIADMLTRIRNGMTARHEAVLVSASNLKLALARILKAQGFIQEVSVVRADSHQMLRLTLRYTEGKTPAIQGIERISKPGRRVYVAKDEIPRVRGGLGICVLSTAQGVMVGQEARQKGIGGEIICQVW